MLEQETDTILETLRARTIGDRESILLREILVADVPRGIKTYMQTETVRALEHELFASPQFSRVNRDAFGVRRQARAFIASMAASYSFNREDFLTQLDNAIHFLGNFLCRPQWTIEHFVFESGEPVSTNDVLAKLDCTVDYAYFRTLIQRIVQRRGTGLISAEEFRTMLIRIDDQIVKQHNARELALLAKPIFDFLLLRDTPPDVSIPLKPILVFFDDKKMKILRDYIESICRIRERTEITLDELTTLVEDLYLGQANTLHPPPAQNPADAEAGRGGTAAASDSGPQEATAAAPSPADFTRESDIPPPAGIPRLPETTVEIPLQSTFDYVTQEPDGREDSPPPDEPLPRRTPEPYERLFEAPGPTARLADLRQIIEGHRRGKFVKRLFGRDESKYEDAMTSLNKTRTWKEASSLLNTLYQTNGLDPFDPDVVEFTDAVYSRYLDAEKDGK